jgi:DNA-binding MarR family transcriptional regulator
MAGATKKRPSKDQAAPRGGVRRRIEPDGHAAFMLVSIANRISASASRAYMRAFGVGVMEWRVLGLVAVRPGITGNEIGQASGVDKSSVSRAIASLSRRRFLELQGDEEDNRRILLFLTPEGYALHDRVIVASLAREERLLHGLNKMERRTLFGLLKRLSTNMPLVDAHDPADD